MKPITSHLKISSILLMTLFIFSCKKENTTPPNSNTSNNNPSPTVNIASVLIPAGTFTMGSPVNEPNREQDETQHQVTLSAFKMSKYEITNTQYATFLNAKGIGSNGKYANGAYPTETLIYPSNGNSDWGLHFNNNKWEPVAGYENSPIINVTWFGATEFATYAGGTLPTEAQWEYACRGGSATAFYTGDCLSDAQANYNWSYPQTGCVNTNTISLGKPQNVGSYSSNAYGLFDMNGNVWEWCGDWYDSYSINSQTNPMGASIGSKRVIRGGSCLFEAQFCRSALRGYLNPQDFDFEKGFRVVFNP